MKFKNYPVAGGNEPHHLTLEEAFTVGNRWAKSMNARSKHRDGGIKDGAPRRVNGRTSFAAPKALAQAKNRRRAKSRVANAQRRTNRQRG